MKFYSQRHRERYHKLNHKRFALEVLALIGLFLLGYVTLVLALIAFGR